MGLGSCMGDIGDPYVDSAKVHLSKKELPEAAADLKEALSRDLKAHRRADVLSFQGRVFLEMEKYDSAMPCYRSALNIDPGLPKALIGMGICFRGWEQYDSATHYYRKALEVDPQNVDAYISLGTLAMFQKEEEEGLRYYQMAVKLQPSNANAHANYSEGLAVVGRFSEAEEELRVAKSLGYRDFKEAEELIEQLRMLHSK